MTAPNTTTSTMYEYIGKDQSDGLIVGKDTSALVGFFGATPVALQTMPTAPATTVATSTSPWGFASSTQANRLTAAVADIITVLTNLGLVA